MGDGSSVEATVAGFIVWLTRQRRTEHDRKQYVLHVERFLRWRHEPGAEASDRGEHAYYGELIRLGEPAVTVAEARTAMALLRRYSGGDPPEGEWKPPGDDPTEQAAETG